MIARILDLKTLKKNPRLHRFCLQIVNEENRVLVSIYGLRFHSDERAIWPVQDAEHGITTGTVGPVLEAELVREIEKMLTLGLHEGLVRLP